MELLWLAYLESGYARGICSVKAVPTGRFPIGGHSIGQFIAGVLKAPFNKRLFTKGPSHKEFW